MWYILVAVISAGLTYIIMRWRTAIAAHRVQVIIEDMDAGGSLTRRLPWHGPTPIRRIARSVDSLALRLERKLRTLAQQRNELEALLGSMNEGVLAVDHDERLIRVNPAAARMLRIDRSAALGKELHAVLRNTALLRLVSRAGSADEPVVADVLIPPDATVNSANNEDLALEARAATLHGTSGQRLGVLVVLHDVTRLRRLETVRSEFVANVSHEMKTPITAIKGFVETLLEAEEEIADDSSQPDRERFLGIILRQADRLQAIFEDLLTLARIEGDSGQEHITFEQGRVRKVVDAATEACRISAVGKDIDFAVDCDPDLLAKINAPLLEHALVNLMDNAIKYSEPGSQVRIAAAIENNELCLAVTDHGVGIPSEHIPRLFERFYRVDRARSREMGGTGLGLAIVKHVVQAHNGRVDVVSDVGEGSTFRLMIPQEAAPAVAQPMG